MYINEHPPTVLNTTVSIKENVTISNRKQSFYIHIFKCNLLQSLVMKISSLLLTDELKTQSTTTETKTDMF